MRRAALRLRTCLRAGATALMLAAGLSGLTGCSGGGGGSESAPTWRETPLSPSSLPPVQVNVAGGAASWMYANVLQASEGWVMPATSLSAEQAQAQATALAVRPDGWPAGLPEGVQLWLGSTGYPTGRDAQGTTWLHGVWVLTWEGRGQVELLTSENNGQGETLLLDDAARGRIVKLITTPRKHASVFVRRSDPADPVRAVRLWAPTHDGAGLDLTPASPLGRGQITASLEPAPGAAEPVFHPVFLAHLREIGGGVPLRMMSFLAINQDVSAWGSRPLDWSDRADPAYALGSLAVMDAGWGRHPVSGYRQKLGVPYERLIDLANATGNDLWIQVPHTATDGLIRGLARLILGKEGHPGLDAGRRVWFEFSNEIWNGFGPYLAQYRAAEQAAVARFGVNAAQLSNTQRGWGSGHLQGRALATFEDEWRAQGGSDERLINVVAGFAINAEYNQAALAAAKEVRATLPEVMAVSNYFGHAASAEILGLTDWATEAGPPWRPALLRQAQAAMRRNLLETTAAWSANARLAAAEGVPLVSYEGGQHVLAVGLGDAADPVFARFMAFVEALQRDEGMGRLYQEHYAHWAAAGGRAVSLFVDVGEPSYWGYWGARERITDPRSAAPKWDAFLRWTEAMRGVRATGDARGSAPTLPELAWQGEAGLPLRFTAAATGGDGALRVQWMGGELPEGLSAVTQADGSLVVSGTASGSATATGVLRALDADGDAAWRVVTLRIDPAGASANAFLRFDGAQLPVTVQPDGRRNGRYDPRRAAVLGGSAGQTLCVPFSTEAGSALFGPEYGDGSTRGEHRLGDDDPRNLHGGWCLRQTRVGAAGACPSSFTGLRDGAFISWSGANCAGTGEPSTLDLFLVWHQRQFTGGPGQRVGFGPGAALATLRADFSALIGDGDNELRFAVLDGGTWWLSEAAWTRPVVAEGFFEITAFDASAEPGRRWARFVPATEPAMPDVGALAFGAHAFTDVQAVALVYRGRRWGYHYGVAFPRFMALGRALPGP